ncbi:hypothetical protein [Leyella stercorea]|uniref:hypothetical protein n=1 Tax=Leyella stercorea TaxID=363265 RepID=UPI003AB64075
MKVNTSGGSGITAKLGITVDGKEFGEAKKISATATEYEFTGSGTGKISINWTEINRGIYIKSIEITYEETPATTTTFGTNSGKTFTFTNGKLEGFTAPKATATKSDDNTDLSDLIEYASSDADIVAVDSKSGELTFTNTKFGEATITATLPKTATYQTSTDSYFVENKDNHIATSLSFNGTDITLTEGKTDAGADFTGYTATEANNIAGTITYAASGDAVATVNPTTGAVTINAAVYGTTTITATFTPADPTQYSGSTATYKITNQQKIDESTIVFDCSKYDQSLIGDTYNNNDNTPRQLKSVAGKDYTFTLTQCMFNNNSIQMAKTKKGKIVSPTFSSFPSGYKVVVTYDTDNTPQLYSAELTDAKAEVNTSLQIVSIELPSPTATFTIQSDTKYTQIKKIELSALIIKDNPALSFAEATVTKELVAGTINLQTITKPEDLDASAITYASSDDATAKVEGNRIRLYKTGEVTITATSAATDKYAAGTASYKLVIEDNRIATAIAFDGFDGTTVALTDGKTADGAEFTGYTAKAADNIEGTIKYAASGDAVATVNETTGAVTINATTYGTTTITATFTPTDATKYTASTAEYKITNEKGKIYYTTLAAMKQAVPTTATNSARATLSLNLTDAIVTSVVGKKAAIQDATAGILVYGNNAFDLVKGKKYTGKVDVKACWFNGYVEIVDWTPSADIVVEDAAELPLETITLAQLKADPDKYEFKRVKVSKVTTTTAYSTAKKATITQDGTDATLYGEDTGLSVSINTIYDLIGCAYHHKTSYSDEYRIGIFAQEDITEIVKETPTLSFAETTVTKQLAEEVIDLQTITKPEDLDAAAITYASSDNETAEVYEGQILMYKTGEVTITATSAATDKYAAGTASYKLVIEDNRATDTNFKFAESNYKVDMAGTSTAEFNAKNVLQNPNNLKVTYTISPKDEDVEIDASTGYIVISKRGIYTITATGDATNTYKKATATCTLKVFDNTKQDETFTFIAGLHKGTQTGNSEEDQIVQDVVTIHGTNAAFAAVSSNNYTYRLYQGCITTISTKIGKITKIEFIGSNNTASNNPLTNLTSMTDNNYTCTDPNYGVWEGSAKEVEFKASAQVSAIQIIVTILIPKEYTMDETKTNNVIEDCAYANVTLQRTLEASHWNSFCVPFALDKDQVTQYFGEGTQLRTYEGRCENNIVYFATVDNIEAGKPYIMKPGNAVVKNPTFEGVSMVATGLDDNGNPQAVGDASTVQMKGIYNHVTLVQDKTNIYIGAGNKFYYPADAEACQMNGLRAYFIVPEGTDIKKLRANLDGATTSLGEIFDTEESNTPVYNLQGQCVGNSLSTLKSGIYVQNGKKVVVK